MQSQAAQWRGTDIRGVSACSNPRMILAFNVTHYRYMDLIETLAAKLDRILTELRQLLELGTVTTIIVRVATLNILAFRERSVTAPPFAAV
jgi:hypothetical protein